MIQETNIILQENSSSHKVYLVLSYCI